jgi:gentisate 1,2-dioxygenase
LVGDTTLRWKPRDIFVVPSWQSHRHHASSDAVLFSFSDRPVQEALGLWREARG